MPDLWFWRWRKAQDDKVDREFEIHLELEVERQVEAGVPLRDARLAARRQFGSVALAKEEMRDMWTGAALDRFWQDVRYAARILRTSPTFTLASVVVLALGIGATTAIFSLVDATLLRPLPFRDAHQLVMVWERSPSSGKSPASLANLFDWREQNKTFVSLAASAGVVLTPLVDERGGPPDTVALANVTSDFFNLLGLTPLVGRTFDRQDDLGPGSDPMVVVSERLWRNRFGADPKLVGRGIALGSQGRLNTVIGIVPASFQILGAADVWQFTQVTGCATPSAPACEGDVAFESSGA